MTGYEFSTGDLIAVIAAAAGILLVMSVFYVFGTVALFIDVTHSIKKRVVNGEDYSAGNVFLWYLGWSLAMAHTLGLATIIYFFVKRSEINETKQRYTALTSNIRNMSVQQGYQQQYQQQPYQYNQPH